MSRDSQAIIRAVQNLLRSGNGKAPAHWLLLGCLLLAGYLVAEPWLEKRLGVDLPGVADLPSQPTATRPTADQRPTTRVESRSPKATPQVTVESLLKASGQTYTSPAGLRYSRGTQHGHHLRHLMAHTVDEPERPVHGVFDSSDVTEVIGLVDEAYQQGRSGAHTTERQNGDRTIYVVDMGRRVGYVGGRSGRRDGRPAARHIQLVVVGNKFITSYPVIPR